MKQTGRLIGSSLIGIRNLSGRLVATQPTDTFSVPVEVL